MKVIPVNAKFEEFNLPVTIQRSDESVITPTITATLLLKYGKHNYFFKNFKTLKGISVTINHLNIISPGFKRFVNANYKKYTRFKVVRTLFQKFHYGFSFIEQMMYLTTPHSVTSIGDGRFVISFMTYFGFLLVDCRNRTVKYHILEEDTENSIMGNHTWYDSCSGELYYTTYSLNDSMNKCINPDYPVHCRIMKYKIENGSIDEIWNGSFSDYLHDINIDASKKYCVVCEFSMYEEKNNSLRPSNVLVVDMVNKKHWIIPNFQVSAHSPFDPVEPDLIYFSNHNFRFVHTKIFKLLKNAIFSIDFKGPASVYKYRLTPNGPTEEGVFTEPDMFRMQNMHVFIHRNQKIIAGLAFPDHIFIANADSMKLMKKIKIFNRRADNHILAKKRCSIGTFSPSIDGEYLYVHTNKSFQIIDIETENVRYCHTYFFNKICPNHMQTSKDIDW